MNDDIRDEGEPLTQEDMDGCMGCFRAWGLACLGVFVFIAILGYALGVW